MNRVEKKILKQNQFKKFLKNKNYKKIELFIKEAEIYNSQFLAIACGYDNKKVVNMILDISPDIDLEDAVINSIRYKHNHYLHLFLNHIKENDPDYGIFISSYNYPFFLGSCISYNNFAAVHILTKAYNNNESFSYDVTDIFNDNVLLPQLSSFDFVNFLNYEHFYFNEKLADSFKQLLFNNEYFKAFYIFDSQKQLLSCDINISGMIEFFADNFEFHKSKIFSLIEHFDITEDIKSYHPEINKLINIQRLKDKVKSF